MIKNFQNASHYFYHHPAVTMFDKTFGLQTTEKVAPTGLEPLRVSKLRAPPPKGRWQVTVTGSLEAANDVREDSWDLSLATS